MRRAWVTTGFALVIFGCSGAPIPAGENATRTSQPPEAPAVDPCEQAPVPLTHQYDGVLAQARCRAEVDVIMQGVSRALGVKCNYCHLERDFSADTDQKRIANFMARELVPRVKKKNGAAPTCASCHQGVAKILGAPRNEARALEWMTSFLTEEFTTSDQAPLRCKSCHGANWGAPEFRRRVLLTNALEALPRSVAPARSEATPK